MKNFALLLVLVYFCANAVSDVHGDSDVKHYIVYMGGHSNSDSKSVLNANHELLASVLGSVSLAKYATVYHYTKSFRGFSALLTREQANQISKESSVVSVIEDKAVRLATSRSWEFMESEMFTESYNGGYERSRSHGNAHRHPSHFNSKNLSSSTNSWYSDKYGQKIFVPESSDVIIGVIDGGIWPEAASFSDIGLGPVPSKFNGECLPSNSHSGCSRKIIGGRYYYKGYEQQNGPLQSNGGFYYLSARDSIGHGTHAASIAAGAAIKFNMAGLGDHTMHGGAPGARLSVYKPCWFGDCMCSDVLAGYDDAISDNVDVISMSLGPETGTFRSYSEDCFAGPTLAAFKKGIFVSASAGNAGSVGSVANAWPWITTVAASSIDRVYITPVVLGNSVTLQGYGVNMNEMQNFYQIISGEEAASDAALVDQARLCRPRTLDSSYINGRIVICEWDASFEGEENSNAINYIRQQGGAGVIFITNRDEMDIIPEFPPLTSSLLNPTETQKLQQYLTLNRNPVARILSSQQVLTRKPEPRMAKFSSRGPNPLTPALIKPDITAPGVNIIGAYFVPNDQDPGIPYRGIMSGTSMACPHVTGAAAMIKHFHNDWSPAAIRSAIMTTALSLNSAGCAITSGDNPATPFDFGSGHLNPRKALDPGLVYDFGNADMAEFMCNFNNEDWVRREFDVMIDCYKARPPYFLNYPSISVVSKAWPVTVTRTLTYVGGEDQPKVFGVQIIAPEGTTVSVEPAIIDFTSQRDVTYAVTFMPGQVLMNQYYIGSIAWKNEVYEVRSPISIYVE